MEATAGSLIDDLFTASEPTDLAIGYSTVASQTRDRCPNLDFWNFIAIDVELGIVSLVEGVCRRFLNRQLSCEAIRSYKAVVSQ